MKIKEVALVSGKIWTIQDGAWSDQNCKHIEWINDNMLVVS